MTVLDFACGEGALLEAVARQSSSDLQLFGADIDANAVQRAQSRLPGANFAMLDALDTSPGGLLGGLQDQTVPRGVQGVILNPPWGVQLRQTRYELQEAGFKLANGQFDSADLFVELAIKLLSEGGAAALILPDSLFYPDHAPLRRVLLETCTLDLVARLGEGFFPGIFRGTAVLVLRRGLPADQHLVECLRLSPEQRKLVLSGNLDLEQVASSHSHWIPQRRFARSSSASFAIDLRQEDLRHVNTIYRQEANWTHTLTTGRGVELSKNGEIIVCLRCKRGRPRPRTIRNLLCECGQELDLERVSSHKIVRKIHSGQSDDWVDLIAGEDVKRYRCAPSREIQLGVPGINYKAKTTFDHPRLLVRKTGIGIKAALFQGNSFTTQTVFHYQATDRSPSFLLPYVLGVLSSRIMLAVHLKRTGEIEWRSHPYVTQKLLNELPIPHPTPDTQQWKQARAIAHLVTKFSGNPITIEQDLTIERLVAGLYGLELSDIEWVDRVLNEAQGMETVASLRLPADYSVSPVLVD